MNDCITTTKQSTTKPCAYFLGYTLLCVASVECSTIVYPKKYAHGFVVLCFVVVTQSFIMNSHEVFIHIHQGCFAGTGAIVRLPQCQWSKPDGYGKISQCITTTKHSKAKIVYIFLGVYYRTMMVSVVISFMLNPTESGNVTLYNAHIVYLSVLTMTINAERWY